jgi:hypothetical protein
MISKRCTGGGPLIQTRDVIFGLFWYPDNGHVLDDYGNVTLLFCWSYLILNDRRYPVLKTGPLTRSLGITRFLRFTYVLA